MFETYFEFVKYDKVLNDFKKDNIRKMKKEYKLQGNNSGEERKERFEFQPDRYHKD